MDKSRYNIFLLVFRLSKYDNDICVNGEVLYGGAKMRARTLPRINSVADE
ncbi:MAG TPA: hypothetical protein VE223_07085 [Nitrososphaeraceae archaeon]|nr:hypothetical protein [Nitrososphaeraceae archaeon]